MNIVNHLAFTEREQKFVVITLSDGQKHFCTMPLRHEGMLTAHRDIVRKFCKEHGFHHWKIDTDLSVETATKGNITLTVQGGGTIRIFTEDKLVFSGLQSGDYGKPGRSIVEHCIKESLAAARLKDYVISVQDVKEN